MEASPRYGQYDVSMMGTDDFTARVLVLPDVPTDPADVFLARAYARAQKASSVLNMYSRWLNTTAQYLARGKPQPVDGPVSVHIIASTGHCPAAITALLSRLAEAVVTDTQQVEHWTFSVDPDESDEPRVFIVVAPVDKHDDIDTLTRADVLAMFPE